MKVVYLGIILTFLLVAMSYAKPIHAESSDPVQILNVQVQPNIIKVNDTFSLNMAILNNSPFPIYLTSGSCSPAFSVVFDAHAKQVYPNIACTAEAILQRVDPQSQVTISNANKPGVIYQAVQPGTATVNITLSYYAKNQTATDYSNIYYNTSKSFQFLIQGANPDSLGLPISTAGTILSPLEQFKSGIPVQDVKCNQGLQLVVKAEDNSPACVKFDTATILIKHGWASSTFGISSDGARTYVIPDSSVSFLPCNTPYPQNGTGEVVLYMPVNSTGKICVRYYNLNNTPTGIGMRIFDADNLTQNASNVTAWTDNSTLDGNANKTIVYFIKTGTRVGFYGVSLNCGGLPLAVGYNTNSTMTASDFPWIGRAFHCGVITYDSHIEGTTGIGVKYIPYP